ncbi:MAG: hypothetical protein NVSMB51_18600 [Solirubrobacteraceae bacterium]
MQSDLTKRLAWSGLTAALGALAAVATRKVAVVIWKRVFDEEPPE